MFDMARREFIVLLGGGARVPPRGARTAAAGDWIPALRFAEGLPCRTGSSRSPMR